MQGLEVSWRDKSLRTCTMCVEIIFNKNGWLLQLSNEAEMHNFCWGYFLEEWLIIRTW